MLLIMEDESKIFVDWLIKLVKIDKKITGKNIANLIGVSQPTIAGYMSGRTKPNFKVRQAILEATNTTHEEMLDAGRQESKPQVTQLTGEDVKKIIAGEMSKYNKPVATDNVQDLTLTKHIDLLKQFPEDVKEKALDINSDLVELARLDPGALNTIHDNIQTLIEIKRRTAEAKDNGSSGV